MGGPGHAQDVVDAHQRIGDDDGFHGRPKGADLGVLVRFTALVGQQAVSHPQQTQATDQHQAGNLQQPDHSQRHRSAHHDGTHRSPPNGFFAQVVGQIARGQGNDDGVVTGQHQINQNNGQERRPPSV